MGRRGGKGNGSLPSPGVSPLAHSPPWRQRRRWAQLLPTLAGWEAAVAATLERRRALTAHALAASSLSAPRREPRRRRAPRRDGLQGAQVESLGGGLRVQYTRKRREARSKGRAGNDVSPGPAPSLQAVSVTMATASQPAAARCWTAGWVATLPMRLPVRFLRLTRPSAEQPPPSRPNASRPLKYLPLLQPAGIGEVFGTFPTFLDREL